MNFQSSKSKAVWFYTSLVDRIKKIRLHKNTIWHMAISQTKAKHTGNFLGIWVAAINPLLIMLAISFVFTQIIRLEVRHFPLFALAGIFPWMFFSGAVSEATSSIVAQQAMVRQFNFPKEHLPIACVLSNFLIFLIGWIFILPIFIFFNSAVIQLLPILLIGLLLIFIFVSGVGMVLGVLNVICRDIGYLLGTVLMFWFWMTPVFYSMDMVPEKMRWICTINPMAWFILFFRQILFHVAIPSGLIMFNLVIFSALSALAGFSAAILFEKKLLKKM